MEELITVSEAAERTGLPRPTVADWILRGVLPAFRFRNLRLVRLADVEKLMRAGTYYARPKARSKETAP
jgi:excisionase family DNA binding protein